MTIIRAVLQILLQGITEIFPLSGTGHLALLKFINSNTAGSAIRLSGWIQIGLAISILFAFRNPAYKFLQESRDLLFSFFRKNKQDKSLKEQFPLAVIYWMSLLPLLILIPFHWYFSFFIMKESLLFIGICFILSALVLYRTCQTGEGIRTMGELSCRDALFIGAFQALAFFPGISRTGITFSAGIHRGMSQKNAFQLSMLMGVPALLGGGIFEIIDASKEGAALSLSGGIFTLFLASVVGLGAIKLLIGILKRYRQIMFCHYLLLIGICTIIAGMIMLFLR